MAPKKTTKRVFVYDGREHPDLDPGLTVEQVKMKLSDFYGEVANAEVEERKRGDTTVYEFVRRVGTKGAGVMSNAALMDLLESVPPAELRILGLMAEFTRPDGSLDMDAAAARQQEVEAACAQAQAHALLTKRFGEALEWILLPRRN